MSYFRDRCGRAVVDLQNALPPLSQALHDAVVELEQSEVEETAFA